jgi:hypothetical protein
MFDTVDYIPWFKNVSNLISPIPGTTQVCQANANRTEIIFTVVGQAFAYLAPEPLLQTSDAWIIVPSSTTYVLYWARDGNLTTLPWYVYYSGIGQTIRVSEVIWQPR